MKRLSVHEANLTKRGEKLISLHIGNTDDNKLTLRAIKHDGQSSINCRDLCLQAHQMHLLGCADFILHPGVTPVF